MSQYAVLGGVYPGVESVFSHHLPLRLSEQRMCVIFLELENSSIFTLHTIQFNTDRFLSYNVGLANVQRNSTI
jgi:hypothetical protein